MSFLHYQQGDSVWDDPVGYGLNHQSQPYTNPQIQAIQGMSSQDEAYYQQNIQPIQNNLLNYATDPNQVTKNVNQAQSDVDTQFSRLPQAFQMQMSGLGVVPTAAQTQNFAKQSAINKGIASAGARNEARAATGAQQASVLGA